MSYHARCDRVACDFHVVEEEEQVAVGAARAHHINSGHHVTVISEIALGFRTAAEIAADAGDEQEGRA